jgi:hypothetical protein
VSGLPPRVCRLGQSIDPRSDAPDHAGCAVELLQDRITEVEQLEWAVAQFQPDLEEETFSAAWYSDDPSERIRADSVLSSFEKTYMLLMDLIALSVKIAVRLGTLSVDQGTSLREHHLWLPARPVTPRRGVAGRTAVGRDR